MRNETWSNLEKRAARRAYDAALQRELAEIMAKFKRRAAAAKDPDEMWSVEQFLSKARLEIDRKYDFRYSQLIHVFARLVHEGRIAESDLVGLSEEKIAQILGLAAYFD